MKRRIPSPLLVGVLVAGCSRTADVAPEPPAPATIHDAGPAVAGPATDDALLEAVRTQPASVVEDLLKRGANPQAPGKETAAFVAARAGKGEMFGVLKRFGADLDRPGPAHAVAGPAPMHEAARRGDIPTVQALLNAGANPDGQANGDTLPVDVACEAGQVAMVDFLWQRTPSRRSDFARYAECDKNTPPK